MKAIDICAIVSAAHAWSIEILNSGFKHLAWLGMLLATAATADESLCIIPTLDSPAESQPIAAGSQVDGVVEFRARQGRVGRDGNIEVSGDVEVTRDDRYIRADKAEYDSESESFSVSGNVEYLEPGVRISGSEGRLSGADENVSFTDASYVLTRRPARGEAEKITISGDRLLMEDILYTTCPEGSNDWTLRAKTLELDREKGRAKARNVTIRLGGIPVLYFPYLSFPTSDKRKSGLLIPTFGSTERSGTEFSQPYYWNIAPNYDATLRPVFMSDRGWQQNIEFRYLAKNSTGQLDLENLNDDRAELADRSYGLWQHNTTWANGWRATTYIEDVSDQLYFEDFGRNIDTTSRTHLERNLQLDYANDNWWLTARTQNFKTIDPTLADDERPYERLPQLLARGQGHTGVSRIDWTLNMEAVNFHRETGVTGSRLNVRPGLTLTLGGPGYYLTPSAAWDYTAYDLDDPGRQNLEPTRSLPIITLDSGLIFERAVESNKQLVQTLEPRVFYAHIPFQNQDELPIFDTAMPTFNTVELFRANRFVGIDRLGDTDQVSVGVTTRLLDESQGRQVFSATLGQAFFLSDRQVTLLSGALPPSAGNSQLIVELDLALYRKWNLDLTYQWDPDTSNTAISQFRVQYLPGKRSVVNVAHRFQRGVLEESDFSFVMPFSRRWNMVGRLNYSLLDDATLERLVGLEYQSCCWGVRLVSRRYISRRSGESDSSFLIQIELKGLSKFGSRASAVLKNGILGYPDNN